MSFVASELTSLSYVCFCGMKLWKSGDERMKWRPVKFIIKMSEIQLELANGTGRDSNVLLTQFVVMSTSWDQDYCKMAISAPTCSTSS